MREIENIDVHAKEIIKDMDKRLAELKVQADYLRKKASKTVMERPLLALGVAFVMGMALGVALSKSSD